MKGNLLLAQSGGATAVINASAAGVISKAVQSGAFKKVLCAHFGLNGILNEDFFDVSELGEAELDLLSRTPASAFGSCRYKLPDYAENPSVYEKIAEVFRKNEVSCLVYNGGNDSMDTCNKIYGYFEKTGFPCKVIGVPKTVDNDLAATHHCPGYGSASKYIATTVEEIALDTAVYEKGRVTVCEIMGRDTGWLTAACAIANLSGAGPDLIYLPERPFDVRRFILDAEEVYKKKGRCLAVVAEGIRDENGYVGSYAKTDSFSHVQLGGAAVKLADAVKREMNVNTRAIDLSLPQRAAAHILSLRDWRDAKACGEHAVRLALDGESGVMVSIKTEDGKTVCESAELSKTANAVKRVPQNYVSENGRGVSGEFYDYVLPLVEGEVPLKYEFGIPKYFDCSKLKKLVCPKR